MTYLLQSPGWPLARISADSLRSACNGYRHQCRLADTGYVRLPNDDEIRVLESIPDPVPQYLKKEAKR